MLAFALQLKKKHGKTSFRVVEKFPDIPVAAVQYPFTHKQYTEQHNDTEYTERKLFTPAGSESCTKTEGHPLLAHGSAGFQTKEL
jgi:hypothetical protein